MEREGAASEEVLWAIDELCRLPSLFPSEKYVLEPSHFTSMLKACRRLPASATTHPTTTAAKDGAVVATGAVPRAVALLEEMRGTHGLEPNDITYSAAMRVAVGAGDQAAAVALYQQALSSSEYRRRHHHQPYLPSSSSPSPSPSTSSSFPVPRIVETKARAGGAETTDEEDEPTAELDMRGQPFHVIAAGLWSTLVDLRLAFQGEDEEDADENENEDEDEDEDEDDRSKGAGEGGLAIKEVPSLVLVTDHRRRRDHQR